MYLKGEKLNYIDKQLNVAYLIIILVHTGIVSFKDEFFLEVHVTFILDVFREPLLWSIGQVNKDFKKCKHLSAKKKEYSNVRALITCFSLVQ